MPTSRSSPRCDRSTSPAATSRCRSARSSGRERDLERASASSSSLVGCSRSPGSAASARRASCCKPRSTPSRRFPGGAWLAELAAHRRSGCGLRPWWSPRSARRPSPASADLDEPLRAPGRSTAAFSCSTTASTCSTPQPISLRRCSSGVQEWWSWRRVASRSISRASRSCRCDRSTPRPTRCRCSPNGPGASIPSSWSTTRPCGRRGDLRSARRRAPGGRARRRSGRHHAPADIATRLDDRFRLLSSGRRRSVDRHQTLRATLEWSHQLLDEAEQARVSTARGVRGRFHRPTPLAPCAATTVRSASLVRKSLVQFGVRAAPGSLPTARDGASVRARATRGCRAKRETIGRAHAEWVA